MKPSTKVTPASHRPLFSKRGKPAWKSAALGCVLGLAPLGLFAQSYTIDWFKVAGGGGTSTGGVYAVSGTLGQQDAGGSMTNGNYCLVGGFWALPVAVQTPGAPTLHITNASPGSFTLWWTPNTPGFTLQVSDSLAFTSWTTAPSGTNNPAVVPATAPRLFFRLFSAGP